MSGIFISYRRSTSKHLARSIFMALQQRGHDVFLDVNSIDSGAFDRIILNQIAARPHFLLLLSPGSLERCVNPSDWLLQEIQEAFRLNRNIIPIHDEGFDLSHEKQFLPEPIRTQITLKNAPPYSHYYFDAFIQTISDRFLKQPLDNVILTPTPTTERDEVQKRIQQAGYESDSLQPLPSTKPPPAEPAKQSTSTAYYGRPYTPTPPKVQTPAPTQPLIWGVENILPPPFEWVYIPPGSVDVEINKQVETVSVNAFNIAKYPITIAQYEVFVHAEDGYRNPIWWDAKADSREWRSKNNSIALPADSLGSDRPVEQVAWFEAVAFCNWLAQRLNAPAPNLPPMKISLPTEAQWLRAAQGDNSRQYPWGDTFDTTRCNTKEQNIGRSTPVTQFPKGASLYGVLDMSGNVFEMFLDSHTEPEYRGIRGGSWKTDAKRANLTYREEISASKRLETIGFRIVLMNS